MAGVSASKLGRDSTDRIKALCTIGASLAREGRHRDAFLFYEKARVLDPGSARIQLELGNARQALGQLEAAIPHYTAALAIAPDLADAHNELGNVFQRLGHYPSAYSCYRQVIRLRPRSAIAHSNMGTALRALNRHGEAIAHYEKALALDPKNGESHNNIANALQALAHYDAAINHYRQALALKPHYPEALNNLGVALQKQGNLAEAILCFRQALAINPNYAKAHYNLGNGLQLTGKTGESLACYAQALALKPDYAEAFVDQGHALQALARSVEAIESYQKALTLQPKNAIAHNNLGTALRSANRVDEALDHYITAMVLKPELAEPPYNYGHALHALNRPEEALPWYEKAIALKPDYVDAHWNRALAQLALGDFGAGWQGYEWRWRNPALGITPRDFTQPLWLGAEDLAGRTILLHAEQGLGDTLQFARYVPLVAQRGARVILEVQPALVPLLSDLPGAALCCAKGETLPPFDCHCPLMSLPLACGTTLDTIPSQLSYLAVPPERSDCWRPRLEALGAPRIGLVWAGNPVHRNNRNRSIPLDTMRPLLEQAGASLLALQKQISPNEAALLRTLNIPDVSHQLTDFADTAAIVEALDLVITVDTSVAHLAGALGKPVWILLPFAADWRWLRDRRDSPWYPSAHLFRQPKPDDWDSVIQNVLHTLRPTANSKSCVLRTVGAIKTINPRRATPNVGFEDELVSLEAPRESPE